MSKPRTWSLLKATSKKSSVFLLALITGITNILAIWEETSIPSFADLTGTEVTCDGNSFYPLLTNNSFKPREAAFVYYDPRWGKFVNVYRNQFVQTTDYKLYHDSMLYDLKRD